MQGMLVERNPSFSLGFISSTIYTTVPCHIDKRVDKNIKKKLKTVLVKLNNLL
jgi:hypothetical protein